MAITPKVTDVTDELRGSGIAFSDLIRKTGEAVAATQLELERTAAESISALSTSQVSIIAAELVAYNDNGAITSVETIQQTVPAITIVDPPVYQWENVRVQGTFFAQEVATASETTTNSSQVSGGASVGGVGAFGLFFGSAKASFQVDRSSSTLETEQTSDISYGRMRLNALLTPRTDTGIPKPRSVTQGPSIALIAGALDPLTAPDASGNRDRVQHLTVDYRRFDGTAISGALLSIETQGVPWQFETATQTTDAAGQVGIKLVRTIADAADTSPVDVVVTARIGLVRESLSLKV